MFTNKKREGINRFACDVSLYVAETPKASIKYHKPPLPIIPFGIVAYGFVGQPFSKQLYPLNECQLFVFVLFGLILICQLVVQNIISFSPYPTAPCLQQMIKLPQPVTI